MRVLTFSAVLHGGKIELQPGFITEGEPSHEKGELTVEALGRDERPLATTMLPVQTPCGYPGGKTAPLAVGMVAFPENATGLRVSYCGRVLLQQTAPPDELKINVEWPTSLSGVQTVRWRASADGCVALLAYSNDRGETWTPLSLPSSGNVIEVDGRALSGGRNCILELIVTDGFHSSRVRSNTYEVEPKGWVLWILSPAAGATLPANQPVLLAAQGYHMEERRASFDDIKWESSAGGGLGRGAQVRALLAPGEQTITATMHGVTAHVAVSVVRQSGDPYA